MVIISHASTGMITKKKKVLLNESLWQKPKSYFERKLSPSLVYLLMNYNEYKNMKTFTFKYDPTGSFNKMFSNIEQAIKTGKPNIQPKKSHQE